MSAAVKSVLVVWLLLMLSTVASTWWLSSPMFVPAVSTVAILLIAAIKVGLVMSHFMDLRSAPMVWQLAGAAWVVAAISAILLIYLV